MLGRQITKIVLFGGTFDPPHVGHLTMAQLALEQAEVDEVWFLPAPIPPHKQLLQPHLQLRKRMVEELISGYHRFRLCSIEETLPKPSYTVDTVIAAKAKWSDIQFQFLIGSDSLAQLPSWQDARRLAEEITFLVAARTGFPIEASYAQAQRSLPQLQIQPLTMPLLDVSSSWLRERLAAGLPTCGLCPKKIGDMWLSAEVEDTTAPERS